jgi:multiple sugar transport system permease protein
VRGPYERLSIAGKQAVWAWAFLAVPLAFYAAVRFYPTAQAFYLSLTRWDLLSAERFVGFDNYLRLAHDPVFWTATLNSFWYVAIGLPTSLALSFTIAYFLDRVTVGHALLRALYFLPHLTTAVAMAWVWRWFYQPVPVGAFNVILVDLGFAPQPFLRSTSQALVAVLAPAVWAMLGFQIVIFLAGLKAIPRSYYEAAAIDGAKAWRTLWEITLPLLRPTFAFLVVVSSIGFLRIFDHVYNMTNGDGGPLDATKPLVLDIYQTAFGHFEMGYASAQTVVLFVILMALTLLQLRVLRAR